MNILIVERVNIENQYVESLANAYQAKGHSVIFDVQNFLFSEFIPDIVHIHWPEAIYQWRHNLPKNDISLALLKGRLEHYKANSIPIVCTYHNSRPHLNAGEFDQQAYRIIYDAADVIVHHGQKSIEIIKQQFTQTCSAVHIVCPHGPYPREDVSSSVARTNYALPSNRYIFLNFGRQRPNKGPEFTRQVFREWGNKQALLFSIGPQLHRRKWEIIWRLLGRRINNWKLLEDTKRSLRSYQHYTILREVPHIEIPWILGSSDVVFLGHLEGINSGVVSLAASYGKPVVFPDIGNFREQLSGWDWQESYQVGDVTSAVAALSRMMKRIAYTEPGNVVFDNTCWLQMNAWEKHVDIIMDALQQRDKV
jgi:hypothetical protein